MISPSPPGESYRTVGAVLRSIASEDPDKVALVDGVEPNDRRSWSFEALWAAAVATANELLELCAPGDRVAVCAPNMPEWVIIEYGVFTAGLVLVGLNPASSETEMRYFLEHSGARVLLTVSEYRGTDLAARARAALGTVATLEHVIDLDSWSPRQELADPTRLPAVAPADSALLQYTSGTTGRPKGALLTHGGLMANTNAAIAALELRPYPALLNVMPMYHVAGSENNTLGILWARGANVIQRWDPGLALTLIEREHVSYFTAVPTMLVAMLEHPMLRETDTSSLEYVTTGGTVVSPSLVRRINDAFGCDVGVIYGQTEFGGVIAMSRRGESIEKTTQRVGVPLEVAKVRIMDVRTSEEVPQGSIGQICARGPSVMSGYHKDPDLTAEILTGEWLATGDLGLIDEDGYVQITGRLKDVIIRGGENIFAREVEDCLAEHPEVAEAAVVGVPSVRYGEEVAAFVRLMEGSTMSEAGLERHCRAMLAPFKVPRFWEFRDAFPLTASGKVRKEELRLEYLGRLSGDERDPR